MKYVRKTLCALVLVTLVFSAVGIGTAEEGNSTGKSSQNIISLFLGGGFGLNAVSGSINGYIKDASRHSINPNFSLHGKMCLDVTPLSWLNFSVEGEAFMSFNLSGTIYEKYLLYRFSGGGLPGIIISTSEVDYMISFGILYSYFMFEKYRAHNYGYRAKFSFMPFARYGLPFPRARGFIIFDYTYAKDGQFTVGCWGFQLGGEVAVF